MSPAVAARHIGWVMLADASRLAKQKHSAEKCCKGTSETPSPQQSVVVKPKGINYVLTRRTFLELSEDKFGARCDCSVRNGISVNGINDRTKVQSNLVVFMVIKFGTFASPIARCPWDSFI